MAAWRRFLPWVFLLIASPIALGGLVAASTDACGDLPEAFAEDGTTERTEVLGFVASTCEVRDSSGNMIAKLTIVNWSGIVAAIGICAGAWLAGATIAGRVRREAGLVGMGLAGVVVVGAVAVFFA